MTKYAYFNSAAPAPSPVIGWYDTDNFTYPNLPASSDLLAVTADEWAARLVNPSAWAVSNGALVTYTPTVTAAQAFATLQGQAATALSESDRTTLRCYENAVAVPAAWATYRAALRAIVNGTDSTATALPTRPAYPTGT